MTDETRVDRIYLDANFFIYAMEGIEPWKASCQSLLSKIDDGSCSAATSELTIAECIVKPLGLGLADAVRAYLELLQSRPNFVVEPRRREVLIEAARLVATEKIKLPDAIHVATALALGCGMLVTNDKRMASSQAIRIVNIGQFEH